MEISTLKMTDALIHSINLRPYSLRKRWMGREGGQGPGLTNMYFLQPADTTSLFALSGYLSVQVNATS